MTQLYAVYRRQIKYKDSKRLKVKVWKKILLCKCQP